MCWYAGNFSDVRRDWDDTHPALDLTGNSCICLVRKKHSFQPNPCVCHSQTFDPAANLWYAHFVESLIILLARGAPAAVLRQQDAGAEKSRIVGATLWTCSPQGRREADWFGFETLLSGGVFLFIGVLCRKDDLSFRPKPRWIGAEWRNLLKNRFLDSASLRSEWQ